MKKRAVSLKILVGLAIVAGLAVIGLYAGTSHGEEKEEKTYNYIGVKKCGKCHKSESKGSQLKAWEALKHSKAFVDLATPEAKEIAKKLGIEDPQKSEKCLKCHLTEFGVPAEQLADTYEKEKGVQCETCHGPGSGYYKMKTMKDKEKSIAAGLIIPTGELCRRCHNSESPTFKSFCFKEAYPKVSHPNPKKKNEREIKCDCEKDDAGKCKEACADTCNA